MYTPRGYEKLRPGDSPMFVVVIAALVAASLVIYRLFIVN